MAIWLLFLIFLIVIGFGLWLMFAGWVWSGIGLIVVLFATVAIGMLGAKI